MTKRHHPQCEACEGLDHHWLLFECSGDDTPPQPLPDYECKHCDAIADECFGCHGDGTTGGLGIFNAPCPMCNGDGLIERKGGQT